MKNFLRIIDFALHRADKLQCLAKLEAGRLFRRRGLFRAAQRREAPFPPEVMIRITERCDLDCCFCGQARRRLHISPAPELSAEQWRSFIDAIAPHKPYVYFTGGEPLLRNDVSGLISLCSSRGLLTHLNTNGTRLQSAAAALVEARLDYLSCSFDFTGESSRAVSGREDAFARVSGGLRALLAARKDARTFFPVVQCLCTINERNQNDIYAIAAACEELGADVFVISYPIFTTSELERRTAELFRTRLGVHADYWAGFVGGTTGIDAHAVEEQIGRVMAARWKMSRRQMPPKTTDFDAGRWFGEPLHVFGGRQCLLPWYMPVILPDGRVATCWDHPDYSAGSILENPLIDIWRGEKYRRFRDAVRQGGFPTCARCTALYSSG